MVKLQSMRIDKYQGVGVLALLVTLLLLIVLPPWDKVIFLAGIPYGVVFLLHNKIRRLLIPSIRRPLPAYGVFLFAAGMTLEVLAYVSNLGRIGLGETVHLFSTDLGRDLLIGFPHYVAIAWTWAWVLRRYHLSVSQQAVLIGLFWAIVVDEFSYLRALLAGDVLTFVIAGLLLVFGLNWPLLLFQDAIDEKYPNRVSHWKKLPIAFAVQIIPMLVLLTSAMIVNILLGP